MDKNDFQLKENMLKAPVHAAFKMDGYWVWCGSVVKGEDNQYHMFASRWKKTLPFHPGWCVASEIVRAQSLTPEGPYEFKEVVLPMRGAQYWDGRATHNPVIMKHKDEYVLFYMGTTYPYEDIKDNDPDFCHDSYQFKSARSNKRIGIATSKSVFGPWIRKDKPILAPRPDKFDNFFTSNPAPCINDDGSCLLVYKTRSYIKPPYNKDLHGEMQLGVAYAKDYNDEFKAISDKPLFDAKTGVLEDPFIWSTYDGYAMIAKDWKGTFTGDVGSGVYANSTDGINWNIKKDYTAFTRDILYDDDVIRTLGNMDRPFLLFDNDEITHLFVATNDGNEAGFKTLKDSWNLVIPIKKK